jgi:hypothetical protein
MNTIDDLIKNVNSLLQFLQGINDIRPFIIVLHGPRGLTKVNVTQNNFEFVWHFEGLKEHVLKFIRLLIGMVSYYEADSIELRIR